MSRDFDGSADYLERTSAVVTAAPFTICAWFNVDTLPSVKGDEEVICAITDGQNDFFTLRADDGSTDKLQFNARDDITGVQVAQTSTSVVAGTWHHGAAIAASTTDRKVYLDAGGEGTNTTTSTPLGLDNTRIAAADFGGVNDPLDGKIGPVTIWDVALSLAELIALSNRAHPFRIRRQSIIAHWEIRGQTSPEPDESGNGVPMTVVSAPPAADHSPVGLPFGFDAGWQGQVAVAAPPATVAPQHHHYQTSRLA